MKKKIKAFIKNLKSDGLLYALATAFMYTFEDSKIEVLRRFSDMCYDYSYAIYEKSCWEAYVEEHEEEPEETVATPCGCVIFNDCTECGSYPVCRANG